MIVGGVAAAGVLAALFCLTKDSSKPKKAGSAASDATSASAGSGPKIEEISKDTVHKILKEIIASQEMMKSYMKTLIKELKTKQMDFQQTYDRVKEVQPKDPLESYGLSMMEFDQLLDKHQSDPAIREAIAYIMGPPAATTPSAKTQELTVKQIIEIHKFMLQELESLANSSDLASKKSQLDVKTVTIVAQAKIGAKMEEKFNVASEDLEAAVLLYHTMLATDQEFAKVNMEIQHTMGKLMGSQGAGDP